MQIESPKHGNPSRQPSGGSPTTLPWQLYKPSRVAAGRRGNSRTRRVEKNAGLTLLKPAKSGVQNGLPCIGSNLKTFGAGCFRFGEAADEQTLPAPAAFARGFADKPRGNRVGQPDRLSFTHG